MLLRFSGNQYLTYSHIGIYILAHGTSRHHFRHFQRSGRTAQTRDFGLSRYRRAAGGRSGCETWSGTAFRVEASEGPARGRAGAGAAKWEAHVVSDRKSVV